jgi:hypothetical protein
VTSAIVVDQAWVRQRPCREKSTSSSPTGVTNPIRDRSAAGDHGVVHGMPVTPELAGDLVHGPAVPAHLQASPTARPGRSTAGGPRRSSGPGRSTTRPGTPKPGSTSDACATSAGPGARSTPDRPAR